MFQRGLYLDHSMHQFPTVIEGPYVFKDNDFSSETDKQFLKKIHSCLKESDKKVIFILVFAAIYDY